MTDLEKVKHDYGILDVLERLGHAPPAHWNGTSDFTIRCPAPGHDDSTPSCRIHPATGLFYCFGCSAHGDIFDLTQLVTGIRSFRGALEWITREHAVHQPPSAPPAAHQMTAATISADCVVEINTAVWAYLSTAERAQAARRYLISRGLDITQLETRANNVIAGSTPPHPAGLSRHLLDRGFDMDQILAAGWCVSTDRGVRDRFRRRVIFPIRTPAGQVVGVIARDIAGSARAKYLNTPTTAAYRKGHHLYAPVWPDATTTELIVCEGPIDALAVSLRDPHRRGVSPCGTALTTAQARLIAAFHLPTVLMADGDPAGRAANTAWRDQLAHEGTIARIRVLADGIDPALL